MFFLSKIREIVFVSWTIFVLFLSLFLSFNHFLSFLLVSGDGASYVVKTRHFSNVLFAEGYFAF